MPAESTIVIKGMREFVAACDHAGRRIKQEVRSELRAVAEPVRREAEIRASTTISHIGLQWPMMRVGVTRSLVYVAPKQRGRLSRANPRLRRPNLATLLMDKAMEPALARNAATIEGAVERFLDDVGRDWEHD